jgi:hypothetical protein
LVTDPPYGVQLDLRWRDEIYNKLGPAARPYMMEGHTTTGMSGDTRADWSDAYELVPSLEVGLVWHAGVHAVTVGAGLERIGFAIRSQVIWKKPLFVISRGAFAWQHEPAYYVVKRGVVAGWTGSHESTVLEVASPKQIMAGSDEEKFDHPVQKPCLCMSLVIAHHHGDAYDPFLGSGTTLIAAESLGRRCYGLEIDPRFCDVICQRWVSYSGKQPILEGDGRSFEEISVKRTSGNTPQGNATP